MCSICVGVAIYASLMTDNCLYSSDLPSAIGIVPVTVLSSFFFLDRLHYPFTYFTDSQGNKKII